MVPSATTRPITIVSACMKPDGLPSFALNEVEVTQEQIDDGIHLYLVEAELLQNGYEEPFVHFDENEAPPFLHPAVRDYLVSSPAAANSPALTCVEGR
jgi:hypothetical protein